MTEAKNLTVKKQGENETCSSKSSDSNPYQIQIISEEQVRNQNFELESHEDADLDLTLAIGSTTTSLKKKRAEASFNSDSGTSFSSSSNETEGSRLNSGTRLKSNAEFVFQKERTIGFAIEGHMNRNEGLAQSPWMYQRFNLNFTWEIKWDEIVTNSSSSSFFFLGMSIGKFIFMYFNQMPKFSISPMQAFSLLRIIK
jgi:hypothetical protein